jgi:hypothetical protein
VFKLTLKLILALVGIASVAVSASYVFFPEQTRNFFFTVINYNQTPTAAPSAAPASSLAASPQVAQPPPPPPAPAPLPGAAAGYLRESEPIQIKGLTSIAQVVCRGTSYEKSYSLDSFYVVKVPDTGRGESGGLVEFNIQGNKQVLEYGFGFDDNHPSDPAGRGYAEIRVIADGKEIDGPIQTQPTEAPAFRSVPLPGVFKLMFIVTVNYTDLHPVIIDPVVK